MKRSEGINLFISIVLGISTGTLLNIALFQSNAYYGVLAMLTTIGGALNALCGPDTTQKKD